MVPIDYLKELKKKYPKIVKHQENDDEWRNIGYDCLEKKQYQKALIFFNRLCLSQPESFEGFLGVAHTSYLKNEKEKAMWFMDKAIELVKESYELGFTDKTVLEEIIDDFGKMKNDENLTKAWY